MKRLLTCLLLALPFAAPATVIAVAQRSDGLGAIALHDERGDCPGEVARLAVYQLIADGALHTVNGCWLVTKTGEGLVVNLVFENGATLTLPANRFGKPTPPL